MDFDGTLVARDHSSLLAALNNKATETDKLNADFHAGLISGVEGLRQQIDHMRGLTIAQIVDAVTAVDYLMPGARELLTFLKANDIVTIVASGSILPVLEHYQQRLGFDHVVGTAVALDGEVIVGVSEERPIVDGFKFTGCNAILRSLDISWADVVAIGDSPAEQELFERAGLAIAINPKGNIASFADHVLYQDLSPAIQIIKSAR